MLSEQIGDATLYHGDCLEILPTLPKVDAVVTDPPYGIDGEEPFFVTEGAIRLAKWDCAAVILDWRNPLRGPDKVGEVIWEYGWVSGFRSKARYGVCHTHNTIHLLGESSRFMFTDGSVLHRGPGLSSPRQCSFAKKTGHPYEKPVKMIRWLLERMSANCICDPFMGSGTTGVACANLGHKFIGIEIDRKYFDIACERIAAAYAQGRLFA